MRSRMHQIAKDYPKFDRYLVFARFLKNITIGGDDECWLWKDGTGNDAYGQFIWKEKEICYAHIASYELFVGRRHGKFVCHSCDNSRCVNPNHLWLGTAKQNTQDMFNKNRQHDRRGENGSLAKLENWQADDLRKLYATGKYTQKRLAELYGIDRAGVSRIVTGICYASTEVLQ